MPNAKVLEQKKTTVAELIEKIQNASAGVIVDYKGINVENDTQLRRKLREAGVEYAVVKNTLLRFAFEATGYSALDSQLKGSTAIAISSDPVAAAKILAEYSTKTKEAFKIKGGFVDGKVIDADGVKALATLPSMLRLPVSSMCLTATFAVSPPLSRRSQTRSPKRLLKVC